MDCGVCLEDEVLKKDVVFFRCSHNICKKCYDMLQKRVCPFCRRKIRISSEKQTPECKEIKENDEEEEEEFYNYIYADDFVIPRIRVDHQAYRRQKKENKRRKLETLLKNIQDCVSNNRYLRVIPTLKKKRNKKIRLFNF